MSERTPKPFHEPEYIPGVPNDLVLEAMLDVVTDEDIERALEKHEVVDDQLLAGPSRRLIQFPGVPAEGAESHPTQP